MSRRKGERPVPKPLIRYTPDCPIARRIGQGEHWADAWLAQQSTPLAALARLAGMPAARFFAIQRGDAVSRAEVDALARAWSVSSADLIVSIGDANPVID